MKVAYVVPRYGVQIRGGAETAMRRYAEHLVGERDVDVEVLTTGALDSLTWEDQLDPGTEVVNGVVVRRFASEAGRDPGFHPYSGALLADPGRASVSDSQTWVDLQGPKSPDLIDALAASDADVVVFCPYLYYPTIRGLPTVASRAVLHPAAHDEPPLRLPVFPPVFRAAAGLAFLTASERRLVYERFGVGATPQILVGIGVDGPPERVDDVGAVTGDESDDRGFGGRPYLLCIGRVDDKKGTGMLSRYFREYKQRHPGPLALVLVGQVIDAPDSHADIVVTGMIDEDAKWRLLSGATVLVSPSPWESFSITVIEGMSVGLPVLVNAVCEATREHCERSAAGLWFRGFGQFEVMVERLHRDDLLRATLGERGRRYVAENYSWPVITRRYGAFLEHVADRAAG